MHSFFNITFRCKPPFFPFLSSSRHCVLSTRSNGARHERWAKCVICIIAPYVYRNLYVRAASFSLVAVAPRASRWNLYVFIQFFCLLHYNYVRLHAHQILPDEKNSDVMFFSLILFSFFSWAYAHEKQDNKKINKLMHKAMLWYSKSKFAPKLNLFIQQQYCNNNDNNNSQSQIQKAKKENLSVHKRASQPAA